MRQIFLFGIVSLLCFSCYKESAQTKIAGQWVWTIQYLDNPAYNATPQSTGIVETLSYNNSGDYFLTQNDIVINTGSYRLSTAKSNDGHKVACVYYSNTRVKDSVAYYELTNNDDSLFFSHDFIGTVGSGSRHYGRK